ncbi:hypothetical protein COV93_01310 [Candidatus Woesearchaeota archaeon CG11_big_fil_rev_8_21_14_0_20_43_8]|nr:MAG: hypothetical protein COV93_01310 [Candidatus Woesearchaeota archaeon CG11_big_fil_rev_8_21_14_0_20_43_8]PIO04854.1 MAG: hypothetical protein COT47_07300 [Candidatus Woesearchaeota archaeon CG08_land_8_20_14_0_20_43_7]
MEFVDLTKKTDVRLTYRPEVYSINMSREQGEKDLEHLAKTGSIPLAFVFSNDNNLWTNILEDLSFDSDVANVQLSIPRLPSTETSHSIYLVETLVQQEAYVKERFKNVIQDYESRGMKALGEDIATKISVARCSIPDATSLMTIDFMTDTYPNANTDLRIISGNGICVLNKKPSVRFDDIKESYDTCLKEHIINLNNLINHDLKDCIKIAISRMNAKFNPDINISMKFYGEESKMQYLI